MFCLAGARITICMKQIKSRRSLMRTTIQAFSHAREHSKNKAYRMQSKDGSVLLVLEPWSRSIFLKQIQSQAKKT